MICCAYHHAFSCMSALTASRNAASFGLRSAGARICISEMASSYIPERNFPRASVVTCDDREKTRPPSPARCPPPLPSSALAAPQWTKYDRPETNGMVVDKDVPITMSDGAILSADVYRPDKPGRYPVLLTQTPYNKELGRLRRRATSTSCGAATRTSSWTCAAPAARRAPGTRSGRTSSATAPRWSAWARTAAVEQRQGRRLRAVVHGDHAAHDGGAAGRRG